MKEFIISKNDAGQRLDRFISKAAPLLPSSLAQKYIRIKRIKVNAKGSKRDYKLAEQDAVQMYINDEFFEIPNEENAYMKISDPNLDIVYEDDNIILINKPAGTLCHSDGGYGKISARYSMSPDFSPPKENKSADKPPFAFNHSTTIAKLQAYLFKSGQWRPREENSFTPALCNRIDRNTSGIVIAAKNAESLRIINEKLKNQEIDRYYMTIVHGKPSPPSGKLEGFIFKDAVKNRVFVTKNNQPGAKTAIMEYKLIEASQDNKLSLLECRLITGRTHQIRAQLADFGFPILGDGKYGDGRLDKKYAESKQALCSYKLIFDFKTDAGSLSYLTGQTFQLSEIPFRII